MSKSISKWINRKKSGAQLGEKSKSLNKHSQSEKSSLSHDQVMLLADENFDLEQFQSLKLGQATEKGILKYLEDLRSLRSYCTTQIQDVVLEHQGVISQVLDIAPEIEKKLQQLKHQLEQLSKSFNERDTSLKGIEQFILESNNAAEVGEIADGEQKEAAGNLQSNWFSTVVLKLLEVDIAIMKGHSGSTVHKFLEAQDIINQNVYFQGEQLEFVDKQQVQKNKKLLTSWQEVDWVRGAMSVCKERIFALFSRAFQQRENRQFVLNQVVRFTDNTAGVLFILQCAENTLDNEMDKVMGKGKGSTTFQFIGNLEKTYQVISNLSEVFICIVGDIVSMLENSKIPNSMIHFQAWVPSLLEKFMTYLQHTILGISNQLERCATSWGIVLVYMHYLENMHALVLAPRAHSYIDNVMISIIQYDLELMHQKCLTLIDKDMARILSVEAKRKYTDEPESLNYLLSEVGRIGRLIIPILDIEIANVMRKNIGNTYKSMVQAALVAYETCEQGDSQRSNMVTLVDQFQIAVEGGLPYEFKEVADSPLERIVDMKRMLVFVEGLKGNISSND
eukprot:TRINITY_DN6909_c0_g2_i1.p1 TRINITY_DN6909_c0_g2~~TRINITY_DN6909_c0_g2_i1.p1  ORF type:complete len:563 (-),score=65.51 TRINITY_DN6909_c0_g2_i1:226-1914(-)